MRDYLGFVSGLVAVGCMLWLGAPTSKAWADQSAYELVMDRMYQRLLADPEVKSRLLARLRANCHGKSEECRRQDGELSVRLVQRGLARLDSESLVIRSVIVGRILRSSDAATCTAIARGRFEPKVLQAALAELDLNVLEAWATISYRAVAAELKGLPVQKPTKQQVAAMFEELMARLSPEEARRLAVLPDDNTKISDVDVCWVTTTLYQRSANLREPHRSILARYLVLGD